MTTRPPADTAGVPWHGRHLPAQPFAADDGSADPALAAVLARAEQGQAGLAEVLAALAATRVLVPVVAVLGGQHPLPGHVRGDLGAEMAVAIVAGPDGRRALPIFTCLRSLAAWNAQARPVPVPSMGAAQSAIAEDCELLLLDPAGPVLLEIPRVAVWALAEGRVWTPPAQDGELRQAVQQAVDRLPGVRGLRLDPVGAVGVRVVLGLRPGLTSLELEQFVDAARSALAEVDLLGRRAETLELKIVPAA